MRLTQQGSSLLVNAPAKLNLFLKVLSRRPDGFHLLETLIVSIQLYDSLRFTPHESTEIELSCRQTLSPATTLPTDDRNLIIKAARLLQTASGCQQGAVIQLTKRIPSEAGMGGGSSDAAATLVALNQLWKLHWPLARLHDLAAQLGSDINFFLENAAAATCTGRGEQVRPVPLRRRMHFVVIKPPTGLSTREVFQHWASHSTPSPATVAGIEQGLAQPHLSQKLSLRNDLQSPAAALNSQVHSLLARLQSLDIEGSLLTGSGSACFAVCRTARHATWVAAQARHWRAGHVFQVDSGV